VTGAGTVLEGIRPPRQSSKPRWLVLDTLDDRREIHRLLTRISPQARLRFLEWCCQSAVLPHSQVRPTVSRTTRELAAQARWDSGADARLSTGIYEDVWYLAGNYDFDIDRALARLVEVARGRGD
jgi:hypothetical protein